MTTRQSAVVTTARLFFVSCLAAAGLACSDNDTSNDSSNDSTSASAAVAEVSPVAPAQMNIASPWTNADATQVQVPNDPKRIVSADIIATELLVEFGFADRIVGITETNARFEDDNPLLSGYTKVGNDLTPNIEQVAALMPDLIIATDYAEGLDKLAEIAPTVNVRFDYGVPGAGYAWRDYFQLMGDRLGLSEQTADFIRRFDARVASLAAEIPNDTSLAVLRIGQNGEFGVYPGFYPSDLVNDLGLDPVATPSAYIPNATSEQCCPDFSAEQLGLFGDVDVIFLADDPVNPDDAIGRASLNPLFTTLPAAKADRVFEVSSFAWISWTPQGVVAALDDIERHILGRQPS
jgi:iron complex transport system substrate-binding protein